MANKPVAQHVLKYKGGGNVQVFQLLAGVNTGAQDGSDVGTGGLSLANIETSPPAGTFAANRSIEFLNDRYVLCADTTLANSGCYKKNQGGAGQWGKVMGFAAAPWALEGACTGLHVLHPNGVPTLCYIMQDTSSDFRLPNTINGTTGTYWGTNHGLLIEANGVGPTSHGQSIVFKDSIFWAHSSFSGAGGTGALTEYNLKTATLTRYNVSAIFTGNADGSSYALHVHDNVLFAFGWLQPPAKGQLAKLAGSSFALVYTDGTQGDADTNMYGHSALFTDPASGDLVLIMSGQTSGVAGTKVVSFADATGAATPTEITTTVLGATEGADKYIASGGAGHRHRRWSVFVDTVTDPATPRTYLTTWIPGGNTETWEWISSTTGGYGEMQLVGAGAGISDINALPYNSVGGGHRTPRSAVVEIVDTPEEILAGTKVFFRGYGEDSTTTAPSSTLTFYGADTQGTPSTVIPIVPGSLSVGAGFFTNLEAYYHFDDNRDDASGNGLDLNETGSVPYATGLIGNGADFPPGANNFRRPGNDASLDLGLLSSGALAPFAVSVWIDADNPTSVQSIIEKGNNATPNGWELFVTATGEVEWTQSPGGGLISGAGAITAGAGFQHIVVTSDGVTTRLYVDGVEVDSDASVATTVSVQSFFVGIRSVATASFDGVMDELAIWSRYIFPTEVEILYNANSSGGAGKKLEEISLPMLPSISENTIVDFTADNGSTLYSVVLDVGAPGVDIEEGDIGIIITDLI